MYQKFTLIYLMANSKIILEKTLKLVILNDFGIRIILFKSFYYLQP